MTKSNRSKTFKLCSIICFIIGIFWFICDAWLFGCFYLVGTIVFFVLSKRQSTTNNTNDVTKEVYVVVNNGSKVYHTDPQCRNVKPNSKTITYDNAKKLGLTHCSHCR